jgi:hypothetical protein
MSMRPSMMARAAANSDIPDQVTAYALQFENAAKDSPELAAEIIVNCVRHMAKRYDLPDVDALLIRTAVIFGMVSQPKAVGCHVFNQTASVVCRNETKAFGLARKRLKDFTI